MRAPRDPRGLGTGTGVMARWTIYGGNAGRFQGTAELRAGPVHRLPALEVLATERSRVVGGVGVDPGH